MGFTSAVASGILGFVFFLVVVLGLSHGGAGVHTDVYPSKEDTVKKGSLLNHRVSIFFVSIMEIPLQFRRLSTVP